MNNSDLAVCAICGKTYKTCLSCKNLDITKPWRSIADNINCYKIFLAISQYNNGRITKDDAKKQLDSLSINKNELKESVRNKISEIMSVSESTKKIAPRGNVEKNVNSN